MLPAPNVLAEQAAENQATKQWSEGQVKPGMPEETDDMMMVMMMMVMMVMMMKSIPNI